MGKTTLDKLQTAINKLSKIAAHDIDCEAVLATKCTCGLNKVLDEVAETFDDVESEYVTYRVKAKLYDAQEKVQQSEARKGSKPKALKSSSRKSRSK